MSAGATCPACDEGILEPMGPDLLRCSFCAGTFCPHQLSWGDGCPDCATRGAGGGGRAITPESLGHADITGRSLTRGAVLVLVLLLAGVSDAQTPTLSLNASMGFILKAHRLGLGLTQDSLSKLTSRTVTATKVSRLERGLDSATVAQEDSLTLALWRTLRARLHPEAELRFNRIVLRNLPRLR